MKISTPNGINMLDKKAINEYKIPSLLLMDAAARAFVSNMPSCEGKNVLILCGKGNNGGDGYAIARLIARLCKSCIVAGLFEDAPANDALIYKTICEKQSIKIINCYELTDEIIYSSHIIIDAVFGTGFKGELPPYMENIFGKINLSDACRIAVDIPSGLNGETGIACKNTIKAHKTITFTLPKIGFYLADGANYTGEVTVCDILVPPSLISELKEEANLTEEAFVREKIPKRPPCAHKGDFGKIAVVAGSVGLTGAAAMCCDAALKSGAGLVTLYCPEEINTIMEIKLTECMTKPFKSASGAFSANAKSELLEGINTSDFAVIGPGLSRNSDIDEIVSYLTENSTTPLLLDADALFSVAKNPDILKKAKVPIIITPHEGEMARLIKNSSEYVKSNRLCVAKSFAASYNTTVVLKGHHTIIASPTSEVFINPTGGSGMATGGSGDVLCGILAALSGQKLPPFDAAVLGTYIHGAAGNEAEKLLGAAGMLPTDIINMLPKTIKNLSPREGSFWNLTE